MKTISLNLIWTNDAISFDGVTFLSRHLAMPTVKMIFSTEEIALSVPFFVVLCKDGSRKMGPYIRFLSLVTYSLLNNTVPSAMKAP